MLTCTDWDLSNWSTGRRTIIYLFIEGLRVRTNNKREMRSSCFTCQTNKRYPHHSNIYQRNTSKCPWVFILLHAYKLKLHTHTNAWMHTCTHTLTHAVSLFHYFSCSARKIWNECRYLTLHLYLIHNQESKFHLYNPHKDWENKQLK